MDRNANRIAYKSHNDDADAKIRAATSDKERQRLEAARKAPPADYTENMGWVLLALQNAFYHLLHTAELKDALLQTVRQGGDTDTNACIAGALLGAVHGREAIPLQWRQMVLTCRAHQEAEAFRPRPAFCWPVDAHEQAEWLLLCGEGR